MINTAYCSSSLESCEALKINTFRLTELDYWGLLRSGRGLGPETERFAELAV